MTSEMVIDDTIVAISTAAGTAEQAIVRLSGPQAFSQAADLFTPQRGRLEEMGGFTATDGLVRIPSAGIEVPARAYLFRSPRSYTRQDVVELHIPGTSAVAAALSDAFIEAGARGAEAGEFTARAFFSGRIDLSAAEAVCDVVNAADDAQLRSAVAAMDGQVHQLCEVAASQLADILAGVEASIDLAEEAISLDEPSELAERLFSLKDELQSVADRAADMPDSADRTHVVIAGRPNVGKSSLLNALSGTDRAIVSALAGTTRDVLSASMTLPTGQAVTLQDAAGFARPQDTLAAAADNAARRAVSGADIILFVVDASAENFQQDLALLQEVRQANARCPMLFVANKIDLAGKYDRKLKPLLEEKLTLLSISCISGEGLDKLPLKLAESLNLSALRSGQAIGLHARQKRCLISAAKAAQQAGKLLREAEAVADVAELAAVELTAALGELGQISGEVVTEDILARIFARFCVGK